MNVTDDVLDDLLTLYLAGEASADTRALIEDRARREPAFAARMAAARSVDLAGAVPTAPPGDLELKALKQTRQAIILRTLAVAGAVFFTLVPLAFLAPGRLHPSIVRAFWGLAVLSWIASWATHRQVRKAGL